MVRHLHSRFRKGIRDKSRGGDWFVKLFLVDEILTALFEFNESGEAFLEENAVLVTSCHDAKGLEFRFRQVILLIDDFSTNESERRLFYVAMTRAKSELIFCDTKLSHFIQEAGVSCQKVAQQNQNLPQKLFYID